MDRRFRDWSGRLRDALAADAARPVRPRIIAGAEWVPGHAPHELQTTDGRCFIRRDTDRMEFIITVDGQDVGHTRRENAAAKLALKKRDQ